MIIYLIYSTISLGLLLLFYHLLLEKEKMHSINRGFLIFSLIFSFTIPIIPVGMIDLPSNAFHFLDLLTSEKSEDIFISGGEWYEVDADSALAYNQGSETGYINLSMVDWLIYMIISSGMFIRLLRIVYRIQLKTDRSDKRLLNGTIVVLLSEDTTPHTFQNKIYLNKRRFLNGEIPQEVILHEMTHARQKHSLDILLVEFLKILFWFNPLLYLYKHAILLNHEYLADAAVLAQGNNVKTYQKVLLKSLLIQPTHGLASTLNYSLTKKRLQMMTKSKSTYRSVLKLLVAIPLVVFITMLPGCDSISNNLSPDIQSSDEVNIEILEDSSLMVNSNRMTLAELEKYLSVLPPSLVHLKVNPEAQFGIITDVQKLLRKSNALRINYSPYRGKQKNELEKVTNAFLFTVNQYMAIEPIQSNVDELEEMYEEVLNLYDAIQAVEIEITDPVKPPPPPLPLVPSPEKRLSGKIITLPELPSAPPRPPAPVEPENLMQIFINAQGMQLMNDEPVTLKEIKKSIKQFVGHSSADPNELIIALRTVRNTPYTQYIEVLNEIKSAYADLKNDVALNQLGVSYLSLEENSPERVRIDKIYPFRVFIIPPDSQ